MFSVSVFDQLFKEIEPLLFCIRRWILFKATVEASLMNLCDHFTFLFKVLTLMHFVSFFLGTLAFFPAAVSKFPSWAFDLASSNPNKLSAVF